MRPSVHCTLRLKEITLPAVLNFLRRTEDDETKADKIYSVLHSGWKPILCPSAFADSKSFIREVTIPMKLNIPGLVRMLGFSLPNANGARSPAMIITEYCANGSLADVLKKKNPEFGPTELSKAFFGIAAIMAEFHDYGAIHRDLKAGNVLLDDKFEVRISDFGLAKLVKSAVNMTLSIGTPQFMAPELVETPDYTIAVDVFAYAIVMYTSLSSNSTIVSPDGRTRTNRYNTLGLIRKVCDGWRLADVPEIPGPVWELIQQCWIQSPMDRPTFAEIVAKMRANDDLIVPGTNLEEYHEYQGRLTDDLKKMPDDVLGPDLMVSTDPGRLTVSGMMRQGNSFAKKLGKDAMRRSFSVSPGVLMRAKSRYDFTRPSQKGRKEKKL
jgi:serine/threonine protein kinase